MHKVGASFFLALLLFLSPPPVYSQPPLQGSSDEILAKLRLIEERIKQIEAHTQQILANQKKIFEELDRIRVRAWRR